MGKMTPNVAPVILSASGGRSLSWFSFWLGVGAKRHYNDYTWKPSANTPMKT